jgi:outer membrane protein assembly factor BamB
LNIKKLIMILFLAIGALTLSACSGSRVAVTNWPGLSADTERAYLSSGSYVYAVDLKTGAEAWRYPAKADSKLLFFANPVITPDGQLLVGSEGTTHALVSIDPATGKDNWAAPFTGAKGPWVASPLVVNDKIYAPNTDGKIYILDMKGNQIGDPIEIGGALWSTPATDGSLMYVTSLDHHLHILDMDGKSIADPIDLGGAAPSAPVMGKDGAYVGSFASKIEFIQPDGNHKPIADTLDWVWGTPTLDGNILYYADLKSNLYSFDISSGKQNWDAKKIGEADSVVARMLVVGDQIYVATEAGKLIALDRDAKVVWDKTIGGKIYTSPVLANDLILVAPYTASISLAAYDAQGKQAWTFTPAK